MRWSGGPFAPLHATLMGPPVDWTGFDPTTFDPARLAFARRVWQSRAQSEFRSIQILNRFLADVLAAGDPIDVYAGAADLVADEIRHANLCAEVCRRLGTDPIFPHPVPEVIPQAFRDAPAPDRALSTALTMLAVNETLSVGFIADLEKRCDTPGIRDVLRRTIEDESTHDDYGWAYVEASLARYPASTRGDWRHLVKTTLDVHVRMAEQALADVPTVRRRLEDHPDVGLIELGLLSPARQALVFRKTLEDVLAPKLRALKVWPGATET